MAVSGWLIVLQIAMHVDGECACLYRRSRRTSKTMCIVQHGLQTGNLTSVMRDWMFDSCE